jgi:ABC-type transporter Mla maintaining outer membrane lipid asymmetry ATPase subunit MlaF
MLVFDRVVKRFGSRVVLDGFSLTVAPGRVVYLLGRSGQGKSVGLKIAMGALIPEAGTVTVDGIPVPPLPERGASMATRCAMVFQFPALLDDRSVAANLALVGADDPAEALRHVGLSEGLLRRWPGELSSSEQKLVSIARALARRPRYLLLDEPTTALDTASGWALTRRLRRIADQDRLGVLVVSHDIHYALEAADELALLESGAIRARGDGKAFARSDFPLAQAFLEEAAKRRSRGGKGP